MDGTGSSASCDQSARSSTLMCLEMAWRREVERCRQIVERCTHPRRAERGSARRVEGSPVP